MKSISILALLLVCSSALAQSSFVRGDIVLFQDNLANEKEGSNTSTWGMDRDFARVALVNGEKVMRFRAVNNPTREDQIVVCEISPMFEPSNNQLPVKNFTIEFDFNVSKDTHGKWSFLGDGNGRTQYAGFNFQINGKASKDNRIEARWSGNPGGRKQVTVDLSREGWHRFALSQNQGVMKVFIDGVCVITDKNVLPVRTFWIRVDSFNPERYVLRNFIICGDDPNKAVSMPKPVFVPGTEIVFEDRFNGESVGAAPAKWNVKWGKAKIAQFNNENALWFPESDELTPVMKIPKNYLPDNFTMELDFTSGKGMYVIKMHESNRDEGIQLSWGVNFMQIVCWTNYGEMITTELDLNLSKDGWHRLAVSCYEGAVNVYMNGVNIYHLHNVINVRRFSILAGPMEKQGYYLRNVRIAKIIQ